MKKLLLFLASLLGCAALSAQTFVSTEPSNRNVILEDFTGLRCGYCPQGHKIAQELMADNPERLFAINIHQGDLASPNNDYPDDYRTEFGDPLADQAAVSGWPMGTVNRHLFTGAGTAMGRGEWEYFSGQIMEQSSYVNVAARSTLNPILRLLTVTVELYYTGNAPVETNSLNVALLQNNILGLQSGMNDNPDCVVGDQYRHMHMLRHLITGQWGDEIAEVSEGSFVTRTYTYTIPDHLRNIEYILPDLEVVVFVAEGRQEVITGAKSEMQIVNGAPVIKQLIDIETCSCSPEIQLGATIFNFSDTDVTSMEFKYRLDNGAEQTLVWDHKTIAPMSTDTVHLCIIPVVSGNDHVITASLPTYNSSIAIPEAPSFELVVKKTIVDAVGDKFQFVLATDRYASQTSFKIYDMNKVYLEDGEFKNLTYNGITRRQYVFDPPVQGCYKLEVYDTGGNGVNSGNGNGYIEFWDTAEEPNLIFRNDGKFGAQANYHISVTDGSSIVHSKLNETVCLYPNPVRSLLHAESGSNAVTLVEVFNLQGQKVCFANKNEVNVATLPAGMYVIKVHTAKGIAVQNFVKQ